MPENLKQMVRAFLAQRTRRRRAYAAFTALAIMVSIGTVSSLVQPAATWEAGEVVCGLEEHTHTEACYTRELVCGLEEGEAESGHVHGPACYEQQQILTCTQEESAGHTHSDACYTLTCGQGEGGGHTHSDACYETHEELACGMSEGEGGHSHSDSCYDAEGNLTCGMSEGEGGHVHDSSCYTQVSELVCGEEESAGHVHDSSCYTLTCGQEESAGHTHTDACYTTEEVLVCTQPETPAEDTGAGHVHTDACYEDVLTCTIPEHTHTEACYAAPEETPTPAPSESPEVSPLPSEPLPSATPAPEGECILEEHTHTEACYDADGSLICGLEEHTHGDGSCVYEIPEPVLPLAPLPEIVPEDYTDVRTYTDDASGFSVTVYAREGVLPEGEGPVAELYDPESGEYAAAGAALDESGAVYDGYAAMDIRLEAEDGSEFEPGETVYVDIQADALLPEDVDPETVAVQHHVEEQDTGLIAAAVSLFTAEESASVTVETVADPAEATGGVVEVYESEADSQASALNATFSVDSFSTFTITWSSWRDEHTVTVHYVDTAGNEIDGPQIWDVSESSDDWVSLSAYAGEIDGYEFSEYKYGSSFENSNHMADASQNPQIRYDTDDWNRNSGYYYRTSSSGNGTRIFQNSYQQRNIYLVYELVEVAPPVSTTVTTGKTVVLQKGEQPGGLYDLTLSVSGDRGSVSNKQKVDVLFILDESNSMMETWGEWGNQETRLESAKDAIGSIIGYGDEVGLSDNENLDVEYALVGFYGGNSWYSYNDATVLQDWTSNASTLYERTPGWLDDERQNGGTNYEAGFRTGKEVLRQGRDDALTVVIFISDGGPGYYYNSNGDTAGTGDPSDYPGGYDSTALSHAVTECRTLSTDYFYFVGVTDNVTSRVFEDIVDAVPVQESNKASISANDPEDLLQAFEDIQQQITFFAAKDVTITDPLSTRVELVPNSDGAYKFRVDVVKEDGQSVSQPVTLSSDKSSVGFTLDGIDGIFTLSYENETIQLEFPEDYELEQGVTYSVTTTIQPTDEAKAEGESGYDGRADAGTGTHAGESGYWSNDNDNAKVTYTSAITGTTPSEEPGEAPFPKPVVQVFDPGEIEMDEPGHTKQAILQDDGTYDLTLTVSGTVGTATKKAEVDVLMIVDVSNSMNDYGRLDNAKTAMNALVTELENKDTVDARYSIVEFSGSRDYGTSTNEDAARLVLDWNENENSVRNVIDDISAGGGTNYQAGLRRGATQLQTARATATTVVIFLSDGAPTYYIGGGNGSDSLNRNGTGWTATENEAATISCSQFYSVGIGNTQENYMTDLRDAVNAGHSEYIAAESDGSNLAEKFEDIAGNVTYLACSDVTISDTLSEYAEAVLVDGEAQLTVEVTDAEGNDVTETEVLAGGIVAHYDPETKLLTLDFNDDYTLKAGYTYSVTLKIKPTQAAADYLNKNDGVYPDTPDKGTGTHADRNESGFYSNKEANLTYTVEGTGTEYTVPYDDPVIRLTSGNLAVTKIVDNTSNPGAVCDDIFEFEISMTGVTGAYEVTYTAAAGGAFQWPADAGTMPTEVTFDSNGKAPLQIPAGATATIAGLPSGVSATITEKEESTNGYSVSWSGGILEDVESMNSDSITTDPIIGSGTVSLTCTNTTGAVLPSTGGMGEMPYLVVGGMMMALSAGVLLVTQRRGKEGRRAD